MSKLLVDILKMEVEHNLPHWLSPAVRGCKGREAIRAKHRARHRTRKQAADEFREADHPRETEAHGERRPGEFAPKGSGGVSAPKPEKAASEAPSQPESRHEAGRISQRLPTGVKSTEDPLGGKLNIDLAAMRRDPENLKGAIDAIKEYTGIKGSEIAKGKPEEVAAKFVDFVKGNLLALYDSIPADIRTRSAKWYEGGRAIIARQSKKYGLPDTSVAGVYAALSPQKDWFENIAMGNAVIDIVENAQNEPWTPAMDAQAKLRTSTAATKKAYELAKGKTLAQCDDPVAAAFWLRIYDETRPDRSFFVTTPEGDPMHKQTIKSGREAVYSWGNLANIVKAMDCIKANGDLSKISPLMGTRHKVRNFYNNLIAPNSLSGDVTIDTHAVAAGLLRPLAGDDMEVTHNLATTTNTEKNDKGENVNKITGKVEKTVPNSKVTGVQGTYALYAEAYREAAAERNVLPREMQSVTWEAVRGLFPADFKRYKQNRAVIDDVWKEFAHGKLSADEARKAVLTRKIERPEWADVKH